MSTCLCVHQRRSYPAPTSTVTCQRRGAGQPSKLAQSDRNVVKRVEPAFDPMKIPAVTPRGRVITVFGTAVSTVGSELTTARQLLDATSAKPTCRNTLSRWPRARQNLPPSASCCSVPTTSGPTGEGSTEHGSGHGGGDGVDP